MKRNIRKIAILMLIVTLLCTVVSVSAATNPPISTHSVCIYCGRGTVVTKCWGGLHILHYWKRYAPPKLKLLCKFLQSNG